jgi:hypothetical protein
LKTVEVAIAVLLTTGVDGSLICHEVNKRDRDMTPPIEMEHICQK